jgi:Ran GTPase-activating protein (RanGAP) involved in mRNA processing and transport
LDLSYNKVGSVGIRNIAGAILQGNKSLKSLNISMNHLGSSGAESIGILLKFSHTIECINMSRNDIGDEGVELVCQGLEGAKETISETALTYLNLDWNSIHDAGAKRLATLLRSDSVLTNLQLASNGIRCAGAKALAQSLTSNQTLRELNLVGNQIQDTGAIALAEHWCRKTCHLEKLYWEMNCMGPLGERRLKAAQAFRNNRKSWLGQLLNRIDKQKVVSIDLLSKPHSDDDVIEISHHLARYRPRITTFYMGGSDITPRGIQVLVQNVITGNVARLERLYIQNAQVGARGAGHLAHGLAANSTLRVLSLCNSRIDTDGVLSLSRGLFRNRYLVSLDLRENAIGDRGARDLMIAILDPPHPSLQSVNLSRNHLTDDATVGWPSIQRLEDVNLSHNQLTDYTALDLCKTCLGTCSLRWLDVSENSITSNGISALKLFLPKDIILECDESTLQEQTM